MKSDFRFKTSRAVLALLMLLTFALAKLHAADGPAAFADGQSVEVREGDEWSAATVVKKEGRKYQIRYADGTEEWVMSDRVRKGDPGAKPAAPSVEKPTVTAPDAAAPVDVKPGMPRPAPLKPKKLMVVANIGDSIESKWGGAWRKAVVKNKSPNGWILVVYDKALFEWVEPWRIRKVGSTEDLIPYAPARTALKIEPAPKEKPSEAPPLTGPAADAAQQQETRAATMKEDPTYKEADGSSAEALDLMAGSNWKLPLDPGHAARLPARATALKGAGTEFFDRMIGIHLGGGEKPVAIVVHGVFGSGEQELKLEKVDLINSRSLGVYKFEKGLALLCVSPDGKRVLLRSSVFGWGKNDRLELWSIEGAKPQKVLATLPYASENDRERDITAGFFVDEGHAITVSAGGKLVQWDLATMKGIYTVKLQSGAVPAMSAGGNQLAVATGRLFVIIDAKTGKALAELPDERGGAVASLSFCPSGKQLAASSGDSICAWDLSTGKLITEFTFKAPSGGIQMVADNYALVGGGTLVDLSLRIPLWNYEANEIPLAVAPTGQLFFAMKDGRRNNAAMLSSIQLPHAAALAQARQLNAADLMLIKPGVKVSVQVNITGTEEERKRVEDHIRKELTDRNITVADGQPIRIVASTLPGESIEREYRRFGQFGTQKVQVQQQKARMAVESDGATAWESVAISDPGFMLSMKEGQTIEQAVAEATKPNIGFLQSVRLPALLAKPRDPAWYGSSKLTPGGPEDVPLPAGAKGGVPAGI